MNIHDFVLSVHVRCSGMASPVVSSVGAYTVLVSWQPPLQPNGQLRRYVLQYAAVSELNLLRLTSLYVSPATLNTSVSGLRPYTAHSLRVRVDNSAGSVVSGWTNFSTKAAAPSGLGAVSIEPVIGGRSAILSWSTPSQPNGRILNYAVYAGN